MAATYQTVRSWISAGQTSWRWVDAGVLPLRAVLGVIFILHGGTKLFDWFPQVAAGIQGTAAFFSFLGIQPEPFWAYVVGLVEFLGGVALVFGLLTRVFSLLLCIDMIVAMFTFGHIVGFFVTTKAGWEFNLTLAAAALSLAILGAGALSLDSMLGFAREAPAAGLARQATPGTVESGGVG